MSHAAGAAIVAERAPQRGGPYRSLPDFCRRTRVSVEIVINLVRVGAFDGLGMRREELLVQVPLVHAQVVGTQGAQPSAPGGAAQRSPRDGRPPRPAGLPSARPVDALTAGDRRGTRGDATLAETRGTSEAAVLAAGQGEALQLATDDSSERCRSCRRGATARRSPSSSRCWAST